MTFSGYDISSLTTAKDFREYFAEIPEEGWTTGVFFKEGSEQTCRCAVGWLCDPSDLSNDGLGWVTRKSLISLFHEHLELSVSTVNDGLSIRYQETTPKARMLAALSEIIRLGG